MNNFQLQFQLREQINKLDQTAKLNMILTVQHTPQGTKTMAGEGAYKSIKWKQQHLWKGLPVLCNH
jgi:hypothetical protein